MFWGKVYTGGDQTFPLSQCQLANCFLAPSGHVLSNGTHHGPHSITGWLLTAWGWRLGSLQTRGGGVLPQRTPSSLWGTLRICGQWLGRTRPSQPGPFGRQLPWQSGISLSRHCPLEASSHHDTWECWPHTKGPG